MRLAIRPLQEPQRQLDVTHRVVSAIAEELWKQYGGNEQLNWLEAEFHLQRLVVEPRAGAGEAALPVVAPVATESTGRDMPGAWRTRRAGRPRAPSPTMDRSAEPSQARRGSAGASRRARPKEPRGALAAVKVAPG